MKRLRDWSRRLKRMALGQSIEKNTPPALNRISRSLRVEPLEDRRVMAVTVEAFTPTPSGFTAQLSEEIRIENLNLYNSQSGDMGAADVTLQGATGGNVSGSLVVDGTNLTFVARGGALPADTYTATLRSSANGIVDAALGQLLDGEFSGAFPSGNGTAGGDFVFSFTVSAAPALVISLPDFARGPAQAINVPALGSGTAPQTGLPVRFSQTAGITSFTMTIGYNSDLLDITDVDLGPDAPAGSQVEANFDVAGQVTIAFFALEPLTSGNGDLIQLVAAVPEDADYGSAHVMNFTAIEVNAGAIQAIGDSALHVVAFPGDSNGNGRYDAEDARLVARVGVGLDTGFVASPSTDSPANPRLFALIDPLIIGDVTGAEGISPLDASDILRQVVGLPTPNIPALPSTLAPTALALSSTSVAEALPVGTTVGTFTTTDPNVGDTHTYSLVAGSGDTDNASFTITGNALRTAAVFDANVKSTYNIRVQTTDQTGRSFQRTFTITVTTANQAPTSIALSNSAVNENVAIGSTVGTLSTIDPNPADTHTYSLVTGTGSTDNASFSISGNNLVTASSLDFETKSSYSVRIRSTDSTGLFTEQTFTITVTNVNETPTSIALTSSTIAESSPIGTAIGTFSTIDPDTGDTHTYTLVTGTGSTDNASFQIVGNALQTAAILDFETQATYSIRVRSTDAAGLSTEQTFTITVTNVNEAPTSIALTSSTLAESSPIGSEVGAFSTVDPDTGDTHTYTLVTGTGSTDNASFQVVGNSLQTAAILDFETQAAYSIRVRSTDAAGLFTEQTFTITVTNLNEAPTSIALSDSTVPDASPVGTVVGTLSSVDPDAGDTHTYTLVSGTGDADNASFTTVGNELRTAAVLDFTSQASYSVRVRSTDAGGLSTESVFVITEEGINDAPTAIALDNLTVAEGEPSGTAVGNLTTTDPDVGDVHTYTLVAGTGDEDNASFTISGGQVLTAESFDFSVKSSYSIRVRSTDAGGLFTESAFVITVTEVNIGPSAIALDPLTVAENAASGTSVGTLTTTDSNLSDTHTYTLVSGTGDDDNASFTISGDDVVTVASFDFETQSSYTIRVRSTDAGGLFTEQAFVISVTNVNEAPTAIAIDSSTIEDGQPIGTAVGTLSTTDPDAGDSHTYTIVAGDGDDDNASFTISGSDLVVAEVFDFSTKSSYTVRVRSTDADGLFTETALAITVTETNVAPTAIAADNLDIFEGESIGTLVGTLTTTDANVVDSHTYSLVAGIGDDDNASFTISGDEILSAEIFDFSVKSSYSILVRSTDAGGLSVDQILIITINEVNVAPTAITLDTAVIDENAVVGTVVGTLTTTDDNATDTHTYTLESGTGDDDNASFTIAGNALVTAESFDFETQSSYTVRVRSTDSGGLFVEESFVITVTDVNEAPTLIAISSSSIEEALPIGTVVGELSTTDPDAGDTHTYTLVAGAGDDDNASFTITAGDLVSAEVFDFATKSSYTIRIRSTDVDGLFTEESFVITVTETNVAPTAIALDNLTVLEEEAVGTLVGTLTTTDANVVDSFTYTLVAGTGDDNNASFTIVGDTLVTAESFDFETQSSYTVRVRSTDSGGLFTEESFVITVTDVNEAPTLIAISPSSIEEALPIGTVVGGLTTTDPDAGDSHIYTLVAGDGDGDNASFTIVSGDLVSAEVFDFATKSSYTIRIRSTDAAGLFTEESFVITVTETNVPPTAIALDNLTIPEEESVGTLVGILTTTDANVVDSFTYTLVAGTGDDDNASFTLAGDQVLSAEVFDFPTQSSYSIRVRTTDAGGLFTEETFIITIVSTNQAPTAISLDNDSVQEGEVIGTTVGVLSTTDPDAGDLHVYSLATGPGDDDNASFAVFGDELITNDVFDFSTKSSYTVRIRSEDGEGLFFEQIFVITITEINVAPTAVLLDTLTIPENQAAGAVVGNLSSTDANVIDSHTYLIVSGDGDDDNASFAISGTQLVTTEAFDFETKSSYSVRIRTTDIGGLVFEDFFVISVTNVNEAPTAITIDNSTAVDLAPVGTVIGQFSTTDVDAGDTHIYSLVAGDGDTDNGSFEIVGGELRTLVELDFIATPTYSIRVLTTDFDGLEFEQIFLITETP